MSSEHVAHLQRMANESWRGSPEHAALTAAIASLSAQQPAAVDGAMVELAVAGYAAGPWAAFSPEASREAHRERMRAALQAALAHQPAAVDDLNAWRAAFVEERATRYREGGMAIEQARIHAETDAACIDADALAAQQGGE